VRDAWPDEHERTRAAGVSATAVWMIWTDDHLDVVRRLQAAVTHRRAPPPGSPQAAASSAPSQAVPGAAPVIRLAEATHGRRTTSTTSTVHPTSSTRADPFRRQQPAQVSIIMPARPGPLVRDGLDASGYRRAAGAG
jgi:hypothetical protein